MQHLCGRMVVAVRGSAAIMLVMGIVQRGNLHCLLMHRPTRHARSSSNRMERQHGYQEPQQECLVKMIHLNNEYSIRISVAKLGIMQTI